MSARMLLDGTLKTQTSVSFSEGQNGTQLFRTWAKNLRSAKKKHLSVIQRPHS